MVETWLKPNRRALLLGMLIPAAMVALGLAWGAGILPPHWGAVKVAGWLLAGLGGLALTGLVLQCVRPRIGRQGDWILFYLRYGAPIRVPIDVVEAFLLGQGPSLLAGQSHREKTTRTLLVRLAEKATSWADRDVRPSLGRWCDGYITIRGTWCEPLDIETVKRLNRLHAQAVREQCSA